MAFQMTVSYNHPVEVRGLVDFDAALRRLRIGLSGRILAFIVPPEMFFFYNVQTYKSNTRKIPDPSKAVVSFAQYVAQSPYSYTNFTVTDSDL